MEEDKPITKAYRIPDYEKMCPEAGEEVLAVLRTTERKMQYQEYDLKTEQTIINQTDQTITTILSREDSLEQLTDQEMQFAAETEDVEEEQSGAEDTPGPPAGKPVKKDDIKGAERQMSVPRRPVAGRLP